MKKAMKNMWCYDYLKITSSKIGIIKEYIFAAFLNVSRNCYYKVD